MTKRLPLIALPVIIGLGLLILAAYFDNLRGPLLPHIARTMGFDYSGSSLFLVVGHIAAFSVTTLLIPALNRYSERAVTWSCLAFAGFTAMTAIMVVHYWQLLVFAACIGICTTLLGTMSNVVVITSTPPERQGRNLALLHIMYGLGSTLGTVITGQLLGMGWAWTISVLILLPGILALAWSARRLHDRTKSNPAIRKQTSTLQWDHWLVVALFSAYVAGEVLTSMWMTTFLVEADDIPIDQAAWYATAFFVVMALSRAAMMVVRIHRGSPYLLGMSLGAGLLFSVLGIAGWRWCLPLVGLLGPFFPLLLARASLFYPQRNRTITIYVMLLMQVTLGTLHFAIGQLSNVAPVRLTYWTAPACLSIAVVLYGLHLYRTSSSHLVRTDGFKQVGN